MAQGKGEGTCNNCFMVGGNELAMRLVGFVSFDCTSELYWRRPVCLCDPKPVPYPTRPSGLEQ